MIEKVNLKQTLDRLVAFYEGRLENGIMAGISFPSSDSDRPEVKHPAAASYAGVALATEAESRGASLRNPAKPRTPFFPVAASYAVVALATEAESHRAFPGRAPWPARVRLPGRAWAGGHRRAGWRRRVMYRLSTESLSEANKIMEQVIEQE